MSELSNDSTITTTPERDAAEARGRAAGAAWVESGRATRKQLERLGGARERYNPAYSWWDVVTLLNCPSNPGTAVGLFGDIVRSKDEDISQAERYELAKDFWASALGDDDAADWMGDSDFALGFVEGAMGAYSAKA